PTGGHATSIELSVTNVLGKAQPIKRRHEVNLVVVTWVPSSPRQILKNEAHVPWPPHPIAKRKLEKDRRPSIPDARLSPIRPRAMGGSGGAPAAHCRTFLQRRGAYGF